MSPSRQTDNLSLNNMNWNDLDRLIHIFGMRYFQIIGSNHSIVCDRPGCGAASEQCATPEAALVWVVTHLTTKHEHSVRDLILTVYVRCKTGD